MTWLSPYLNKRVEVRRPVQTPNASGGFDRTYETLLTVWMSIHPKASYGYIRGEQVVEDVTHEFVVRRMAIASLGREFIKAFSGAFDSIEDLSPLKMNCFLWLKSSAVKGRLFRIHHVADNGERKEFLIISAEEIEEHGTGYPE